MRRVKASSVNEVSASTVGRTDDRQTDRAGSGGRSPSGPGRVAMVEPCQPRRAVGSQMAAETDTYTADNFRVLEGLEPVRLRPGMYIGSTTSRGLHHLIWEIVDNSVDEALGGHCQTIVVELLEGDVVQVTDDGRGIPVDVHKQTGLSALDIVFTKLHGGGKFGDGGYKVSGGLHGVGAAVTNALSAWLEADVHRNGHSWTVRYQQGQPTKPMAKGQALRPGGQRVRRSDGASTTRSSTPTCATRTPRSKRGSGKRRSW